MRPPTHGDARPPAPHHDALASAILGGPAVALFENMYAAYAAEGRRTAQSVLRDAALAEDAVHTGFVEVLRLLLAGRRWHDPDAARNAVLRNTRWAALNMLRSRRRRAERELAVAARDDADPAGWARAEAAALCEEIVSGLRPAYREALHLRYVWGLSNAEAAERVGVTVHAFEVRVSRAIGAARRTARGFSLWSGVGSMLQRIGQKRQQPRAAARAPRSPAWKPIPLTALAAVSLTVIGADLVSAAPQTAARIAPLAHAAVAPAAAQPVAPADTPLIDEATIIDASAVRSPAGDVVVALGLGRECNCWQMFRSANGGATWSAAPAPAGVGPATRLSGGSHPVGGVLDLGAGRRLLLRAYGGVLCSVDAGRTWRTRCEK